MNHRYRSRGGSGEPIEVTADAGGVPAVFRWRGRRYAVSGVVAAWVEALPWWVGRGEDGRHVQRHAWRVEAAPHAGASGVYDLYRVTRVGSSQWGLERVLD
jgi:hypothetical protein